MIKTSISPEIKQKATNIRLISTTEFKNDSLESIPTKQVATLLEKIIRTDIAYEVSNNHYEGITDEHLKQISSWKNSTKKSHSKKIAIKLVKIFQIIKSIDSNIDFKVRFVEDDFEVWALLPKKDKELFEKVSDAICDYEIDNNEYVSSVIISYEEISTLKGLDFIIEL